MNLETVRYFHLNGLVSGIFFTLSLMIVLFMLIFFLNHRKTDLFRLLLLCAFSFICFWGFNLYIQRLALPMDTLYPDWVFHILKFALPLGVIAFTRMFVQMSALRSEESYKAYLEFKPYMYVLYGLCVLAVIVFCFLTDHNLIIGLTEALLAFATLVASVYSYRAIQHGELRWVMSITFFAGFLSFLQIVYSIFFAHIENTTWLLTFESFLIGMLTICLCIYVVIYSYQELMQISDHEVYSWRDLLGNIYTAIKQDQFFLVYQPKIDVQQNKVIGVEALLRWQHPKRGFIPPDHFIPLSERSYIIDHICRWVIEHAVKQAQSFQQQGRDLTIAINFSVKNLHPDMVSFLENTLAAYDVKPDRLIVEITENIFIQHTDAEQKALAMLTELGVGISLDDYGTGYSSLSTMNSLSISELKIDKSFINDIIENHEHQVIVESIMHMTKQLGMRVVAEGVENDQVLSKLAGIGCNMVQGYGIAKPMPVDDLEAWFEQSVY